MSIENKEEVAISVRSVSGNADRLREEVRTLVMKALVDNQANPAAMRDIMRDTLAGVGSGLLARGQQAGGALREAVRGMDEAVGRSVFALRMALEEARGMGHQLADSEVSDTVDSVRGLEEDLLSTIREASDKAEGWLKGEYADLRQHLARTGTDTGAQVRAVMEKLNNRMSGIAAGTVSETLATARDAKGRLAAVASGILRGLADGIDARHK